MAIDSTPAGQWQNAIPATAVSVTPIAPGVAKSVQGVLAELAARITELENASG